MIEKMLPPSALNATGENKEKPKRTVLFLISGEEKAFDRDTWMKENGIVDIVRMQEDEFASIDRTPGFEFSRYNFEKTVNRPRTSEEPERKYLIARIVESRMPEPLLALDDAMLTDCVYAIESMSYDDITSEQLAMSLGEQKTLPLLKEAMVKSYSKSRKLSEKEIIDAGLGYTLFRITGAASVPKSQSV
jgi:hypothetical protein